MKDSEQMLPRKDIMPLFRKCGLFPLDREVDAAFRAVFKGNHNDCWMILAFCLSELSFQLNWEDNT